MNTNRAGWVLLVLFAAFVGWPARRCGADDIDVKRRAELIKTLQGLSTAELETRLTGSRDPQAIRIYGEEDFLLTEMVRRDRKWSVPLLQKLVAATSEDTEERRYFGRNFQYLMALRRAEGVPDPVEVVIDADKVLKGNPHRMPTLNVAVKNVDAKKQAIMLQQGGDYRTGRAERWRIVLKDEQGREVKPILFFGAIGGGLSTTGPLEFGETWGTTLNMRSFVELPPPGKYTLQVLFHNHYSLAGMEDISNLIVCKSQPLEFVMEKMTIETSEADAAIVRRQLADLDGSQPLQIVAGTYGQWAHEAVSPNSPAGQLMGIGLPAVPPLIEAVQDKSLSPEKRAWLLGILYTISGSNDPREAAGALASYDYVTGPWGLWSGKDGQRSQGGFGLSSSGTMRGGKIDPDKQLALAATWCEWLKTHCEVREK